MTDDARFERADPINLVVGTPHICDTPRRPESEQAAFFDTVLALATRAVERAESGRFDISVAGVRIRLVFASMAMQRDFMPALAHLCVTSVADPDAVFYVWDSESTSVPMAPAPCARDCFTDRGDIWGFDSARFRSAFHWSDYSLSLFDVERGIGTYWVRSGEDLVYWTKASPLRTLFHWLLSQHGCQLLHAAAVGTEAGGALIVGKGGVGKSSTALTCLAAGLRYVADDYLVVRLEPSPVAYALYGTAKLEVSQLERFPGLAPLRSQTAVPEGEKVVLQLTRSRDFAIVPALPLVVALTPRFEAAPETRFRSAPRALLTHAAAFTTMNQLPHAGRQTFEFIETLMQRLPCREMLLGHDLERLPASIADVVANADDAAGTSDPADATARQPFVSVVIPVYNGAKFLPESVASILAQNYPALEIIVVDDGSKEDVPGAVRALGTDVRLLSQMNLGPAAARNLGIRNAVGEFLAFLDVDDLWSADVLTGMVARLVERPDLDVVHGYGQLMRTDTSGSQEFLGSARESFPWFISAAVFRRRAFERIGLFDADLRFSEDTDWFTRAREASLGVERLEQVTLRIRRHEGNMTRHKNLRELGALRSFKKALDRRRAQGGGGSDPDP